ncbi:KilA-N domain-containing protein, partial [Indivirus ILV1]
MLNKHQRVTKYCLVIQGKIEDKKKRKEEEKERIEREREKERERIRKEKEEEKERIEREREKERERIRKEKEEEKERIEREKEKKKANKFRCEYCKVKFSSKNSLFGHLDICLEKYKKIIEDKEKIIEDKEKIIEENKQIIHSTALLPASPLSPLKANVSSMSLPLVEAAPRSNNCKPL